MKVLMISKALVVGAYHAKLRELVRLGVELTVVTPPAWGSQALEAVPQDGYELLVRKCTFSGAPHVHFYRGISEVIGREMWDLVHIDEEAFVAVTYQVLKACERQGKKALFFTWQNLRKTYPPPFNHFERFCYDHAAAAIAGSEEVRGVLAARRFSRPIAVIPQFGVDPQSFQRQDASKLRERLGLGQEFAIGYVGRIVKEKGIADLIEALARLPERCALVLVGSGDFEGTARKLAEKLGVATRIRWVPRIASMEVPEYMNALDVLVLPSRTTTRWKEQFGRVLIEAMACETPVVGSNSGEIPRVIGDAGMVFPEGDAAALAERLRQLYEERSVRRELGAKGRARVLERFTHRRIAEETAKFYAKVLGRVRLQRTEKMMTELVRYPYHSPSKAAMLEALEIAKWCVRKVSGLSRKRAKLPDVLKRRVIASYARLYGLGTFVESGTYLGGTVAFMRKYCRQLYSIEFQPHLARAAQERFAGDADVHILQGDSSQLMAQIVAELREPALFWLDGHFAPETARDGEVACPTLQEISAVLADSRYAHVILIDDACDFRGEGGYPTVDELRLFVHSVIPNACLEVDDDIVRITRERDRGVTGL